MKYTKITRKELKQKRADKRERSKHIRQTFGIWYWLFFYLPCRRKEERRNEKRKTKDNKHHGH